MRTAEVAAQSGVNIQTIRYYERRGLLAEPVRRRSGHRVYDADAVRTVRFVKRAQHLGFRLDEIDTLLVLAQGGPENCDTARSLAAGKIAEVEKRITDLSAMRHSLLALVASCERPPHRRDCPLLDVLLADTGETAKVDDNGE